METTNIPQWYEETHKCVHCGTPFVAHSPQALFCSGSHRILFHRKKNRAELRQLRAENAALKARLAEFEAVKETSK